MTKKFRTWGLVQDRLSPVFVTRELMAEVVEQLFTQLPSQQISASSRNS